MKAITLIVWMLTFFNLVQAQTTRNYYVGHSLVNLNIPYQVREIAYQRFDTVFYRHHINIGASLKANWNTTTFNSNPMWTQETGEVEYGSNHMTELQNPYDKLLLTEAVPLLEQDRDTTIVYASRFVELAQVSSPAIKTYLYATWEGDAANGTLWRSKVDSLVPEWEQIADSIAAITGSQTFIIPGNLVMMAVYDTLLTGAIGSYTDITDFYESDGIHLNFEGNFIMATLVNAVMQNVYSVGTDSVIAGPYGTYTYDPVTGTTTYTYVITDSVARTKIQQIVHKVATAYTARTGYTAGMTPLPVTLRSLEASVINGAVSLNWETLSEQNNDYFEIMHATNTKESKAIGKVSGKGNSRELIRYQFVHNNPDEGINYYRLVQHGFDKKTTASKIVTANVPVLASGLYVYPTSTGIILSLIASYEMKGTLRISDLNGRTIYKGSLRVNKGYNHYDIPLQHTAKGLYILHYLSGAVYTTTKFRR